MGKTIGLLFAVLAIWFTVEVYTQGVENAFGGRLVSLGLAEASPEPRGSAPERAADAVERAHSEQQQRYEALLAE